jgi:hypothetical protein
MPAVRILVVDDDEMLLDWSFAHLVQSCPFHKGLEDFLGVGIQGGVAENPFLPNVPKAYCTGTGATTYTYSRSVLLVSSVMSQKFVE